MPRPAPCEGEDRVPVRVEESLEIRTMVGLRPYRPSGFVVLREEVSGKILVHNYGHGGGGMSLSWGSAKLAVDPAQPLAGRECAVPGAGVMGLSVGRLLQAQGFKVTIYAKDLPPETTSNVSGAQWWPFSVFDHNRRSEGFAVPFVEAARFSYGYRELIPINGQLTFLLPQSEVKYNLIQRRSLNVPQNRRHPARGHLRTRPMGDGTGCGGKNQDPVCPPRHVYPDGVDPGVGPVLTTMGGAHAPRVLFPAPRRKLEMKHRRSRTSGKLEERRGPVNGES